MSRIRQSLVATMESKRLQYEHRVYVGVGKVHVFLASSGQEEDALWHARAILADVKVHLHFV